MISLITLLLSTVATQTAVFLAVCQPCRALYLKSEASSPYTTLTCCIPLVRETIADVVASGSVSHAAVAAELNRREIEAPRGGCWYPTGVARLRQRLAA